MIQAPQLKYMPAQQPMQTNYQQGAYNPVQYNQTPGVIYNYPVNSCYLPSSSYGTDKSQFNGVNIEIVNPQGQGISPQQNCPQIPAQFLPVQQPVMYPQYTVPFPTSQAVVQAPQIPQQTLEQPVPAPQITVAPQQQTEQAGVQTQNNVPATTPVVAQPVQQNPAVDPAAFAGRLKTDDLNAQKKTIEEIAEAVKNGDSVEGPALLDTQVFDALVEVINKDTSSLEAPSPEVIELRKKPLDQLSEEEKVKAKTPTPLEEAEINKQYALYTIAYMQERLNNELEKRNGKALDLKDLPCIEQVIDTAKANPNPMLRISAIASLSHIARPEYKADLQTIFDLAKADEDSRVQEAATKAADALK